MKDNREFSWATALRRSRGWLLIVFLGAFLLGWAFYFDGAVQAWVLANQVPGVRTFMRGVSRWGDWPTFVVIGLACAGIAYLKKNRRWIAIFAAMIISCTVAGSFNRLVKIAAGRARPSVAVDTGWKGFRFSSKYNAFASGHAASSTAFFVPLCFARRRLGLALLAVPALIAASRIYVNAHYLSDVVAGAIIGIASAFLIWHFMSARLTENPK